MRKECLLCNQADVCERPPGKDIVNILPSAPFHKKISQRWFLFLLSYLMKFVTWPHALRNCETSFNKKKSMLNEHTCCICRQRTPPYTHTHTHTHKQHTHTHIQTHTHTHSHTHTHIYIYVSVVGQYFFV